MRIVLTTIFLLLAASSSPALASEERTQSGTEASNEVKFRVGLCKELSEADREGKKCIEIYSSQNLHIENLRPIAAVYDVIRAFDYNEHFGICLDSGVENDVLLSILDVIKAEKLVYSFSISAYPCI